MIRTLPYADLLVHDDEALVLLGDDRHEKEPSPSVSEEQGGTIVRLSAIGAAVLQRAEEGVSFEALANALEDEFGAPPTGSTTEALQAVLQALHAQRLVHLDEQEQEHHHDHEGGEA